MLFVHDHKFVKHNNKMYSPGGLSNEILSRYTEWFGEVTILARVVEKSDIGKNFSEITNDKVNILDFRTLSKSSVLKFISEHNNVILRLPSKIGLRVARLCKKLKKEYLAEVVGSAWDSYWNHSLKGKLFAVPYHFLNKYYIKSSAYALYVTNVFLQKNYPSKGIILGCSDVYIEETYSDGITKRLDKLKNHKFKKFVIGTIGNFEVKYKGQHLVIEAISELVRRGYEIEYQIVGGGNSDYLVSLAKRFNVESNLKVVGSVPHKEINSWFRQLDIYIQPSKQEGLPRAVIEAMSNGLYCIVSNVGGNTELVSNQAVMKRVNSASIVNCIMKIDLDLYKDLSIRNVEESEKYNVKLLDKKRNDFYVSYKSSNGNSNV